jgi:hypothetical protein
MALVALMLAVGLSGAATAAAATQTDTTVDDFLEGTPEGTYIGDSDAGAVDGEVVLDPTIAEEFEAGPGLPDGWTFNGAWPDGSTPVVSGGALVADGGFAGTGAVYGPGRSLEFVASYSGDRFQHVGFGVDYNLQPFWAMVSTGASGGQLYARTSTGGPGEEQTAIPVSIGEPHRFRIVWNATSVEYYVDGSLTPVVTHNVTLTPPTPPGGLRPLVSDFESAPGGVSVYWLRMSPYTLEGTFESRVFDAADNRTFWQTLSSDTVTPPGTTVTFETRTGNTPTPQDGSWSGWQPVTGGVVASPFGRRYFQYRANLRTDDDSITPIVQSVTVGYEVDTAAPVTTIGGVTVTGTTARVTFSSEAGARLECSLDGGPFQACTSPRDYSGLSAATHTVRVRAIDQVGNVGPAAERSFVISSPPPPLPPPPNGDNTAPKVRPKPTSVKVSSKGRFTVRLRCPNDERRCFIMLRVRYRGETIASKRVIVLGGRTANVTLRLKPFARTALLTRARLRVSAVTTARDPSGNRALTRTPMTLRAAR